MAHRKGPRFQNIIPQADGGKRGEYYDVRAANPNGDRDASHGDGRGPGRGSSSMPPNGHGVPVPGGDSDYAAVPGSAGPMSTNVAAPVNPIAVRMQLYKVLARQRDAVPDGDKVRSCLRYEHSVPLGDATRHTHLGRERCYKLRLHSTVAGLRKS